MIKLKELREKITTSNFYIRLSNIMNKNLEGVPTHLYAKCQCYNYSDRANRIVSYVGYQRVGKKETPLTGMVLMSPQGEILDLKESPVKKLSVIPKNSLMYTLRQHNVRNETEGLTARDTPQYQNQLYCYKLNKDGVAVGLSRPITNRGKFLTYNTCYLIADADRTFAIYLQVGKNEKWEFPIY